MLFRRTAASLAALLALCSLAGCHLLFPFDTVTQDVGLAADARVDAPLPGDGAVEADGKIDQDVLLFDVQVSEAGPQKPPSVGWHQLVAGNGDNRGAGVAVDGSGNVAFVGSFKSKAVLGNATVSSNLSQDAFLVRFDKSGKPSWHKSMGGTKTDQANAVAMDLAGNVHVVGDFMYDIDPSGGVNSVNVKGVDDGWSDAFVTSFKPDGTYHWHWAFKGKLDDNATGVAVDNNNDVFVTGNYLGENDLGGMATPTLNTTKAERYVFSCDSKGGYRWHVVAKNTGSQRSGGVAASGGNAFAAGWVETPLNIATALLLSFVNNAGNSFNDNAYIAPGYGYGAAADSAGNNVYFAGKFADIANLGDGKDVFSAGGHDAFITSFDKTGKTHNWQRQLGGGQEDVGRAVAVDKNNNVYLCGAFEDSVTFGITPEKANGQDIFVVSYDSKGGYRWHKILTSTGDAICNGLAVADSGAVYLAGTFAGTISFGGSNNVTAQGANDALLVQLVPVP